MRNLMIALDKEKGIVGNSLVDYNHDNEFKTFDILFYYLRKIHFFCYFCSIEGSDER